MDNDRMDRKNYLLVPLLIMSATNLWASDNSWTSNLLIRARGVGVVPDVSSTVISQIKGHVTRISSEIEPEIDFSYYFRPQFAVEIPAATMRNSVWARGTSLGSLNLGKVSVLPPMMLFQYHPQFSDVFKPYAGVGPNYTILFNVNHGPVANRITYSNNWGAAFQLGTDLILNNHWSINVDFKKIIVKTHATVYALGTSVRTDVHLDPMIYGLGVGYRF
jgi:outer membrane protein